MFCLLAVVSLADLESESQVRLASHAKTITCSQNLTSVTESASI